MKDILLIRFKAATVAIFTSCLFMVSLDGEGQTTDSSKTYHFLLEPYLFAPSMSGTTGVGVLPNTFICEPSSELLKYLKFGAMLYAEVHNNQFAFTSDLFYASLAQNASSKNNVVSGTASMKQFLLELAGLYKVKPWLEFGVGARINSISSGLNINIASGQGTINKDKSTTETWVDPILITRLKGQIGKNWLLQLRADIGGFGIGSKFAWQLQPDIYYRASRLMEFGLGYRYISMDYQTGTEGTSNWFLYDMEEYGPQIRIGFNF